MCFRPQYAAEEARTRGRFGGLWVRLLCVCALAMTALALARPVHAGLYDGLTTSCPQTTDKDATATGPNANVAQLQIAQTDCRSSQASALESATYVAPGDSDTVVIYHNPNDSVGSASKGRLFFIFGRNTTNFKVRVGCNAPQDHGAGDYLDITNASQWPAIITFDFKPASGPTRFTTFSYYFTLQQPGSVRANRLEAFTMYQGSFGVDDDPVCIAQKAAAATLRSTQQGQAGIATASANIAGWQMGNMAQHRAGERIARAMSGGEGGADFSALRTAKADGWTALDSDQAMDLYQDWQADRLVAKLEGLDLEALGTDTAGLLSELFGPARDPALNWYTAGALASFDKQGSAAFDGYAQLWTAGADYRFSPDFVAGANLNIERSAMTFDLAQDGRASKRGWRGDLYAGWAMTPDLVVEGLVSYGQFDNSLVANFDKGQTESERWMASLGITGSLDLLGVEAKPYGKLLYVREQLESYQTQKGAQIASIHTAFGQGQGGLELRAPEAAMWGLTPSLALQGEWDWQHSGSQSLASGALLKPDDWGVSWAMGLSGQVSGFAPGSWIGGALEGAEVELHLQNSDFGRNIDARSFEWSLSLPLN